MSTTTTLTYEVGREKIREFGRAFGGIGPLHEDLGAARAAGYPDLVAPPMFVAVYAAPAFRTALWAESLGVDRTRTVHGEQRFEWFRPVLAGDSIETTARVSSDSWRGRNRLIVVETLSTTTPGLEVSAGVWTVVVRP
jgi:acyl dehydratase